MVPESAYADVLSGFDSSAELKDGRELVQVSSHSNFSASTPSCESNRKMIEDVCHLVDESALVEEDVSMQQNNAAHNRPTKRWEHLKEKKKESHTRRLAQFQGVEVKKDRATRRLDNRASKKQMKKEGQLPLCPSTNKGSTDIYL
jgi:hypothetical protein